MLLTAAGKVSATSVEQPLKARAPMLV